MSTREIKFCSSCTISNQRPRISFSKAGICNACDFRKVKKEIDWVAREAELQVLLDKHRDGEGEFDVIVPCSGGKDGSFVAHQLKEKYGMRVLAVTWAPLKPTEIGRKNLDNFIASGFDHILGTPNPSVTARLTRFFFEEIGDPFQPFIFGQANFPLSMAKKYGVSLVMYGENGEVEYGGDQTAAMSPIKAISNEAAHYFSGITVEDMFRNGYTSSELQIFRRPSELPRDLEQHFFGYYKFWDPQENFYYASENVGFEANELRSEGTYSRYASLDDKFDGFHYYLAFIKFGIGRATSDSAHEIRDGKITRDEGIELVRQFDGEFPKKYFGEFLDFIGMSDNDFYRVIDSWRKPHVWEARGGEWNLVRPIWKENLD